MKRIGVAELTGGDNPVREALRPATEPFMLFVAEIVPTMYASRKPTTQQIDKIRQG